MACADLQARNAAGTPGLEIARAMAPLGVPRVNCKQQHLIVEPKGNGASARIPGFRFSRRFEGAPRLAAKGAMRGGSR
jgi:hypothetical protein